MLEPVKCPGCDVEISPAWTGCPYCGHGRPPSKKEKGVKGHQGRPPNEEARLK